MSSGRVFSEGSDISTRPRALLDRGAEQMELVAAAMLEWSARARPRVVTEVEDDRSALRHVLRIDAAPETVRWSMLLGEAIHTFREALDALAWDLVHVDGAEPAEPSKVYFPIADTAKSFKDKRRALVTMPSEASQRIRDIQPLALGAQLWTSDLWAVHRFDIDKKHRGELIAGRVDWAESKISSGRWTVESIDNIDVEMPQSAPPIADGSLLVTVHFDPPAIALPGEAPVDLPLTFVVGEGNRTLDLGVLIAGLPIAMRGYFEYILTGANSPR